MDLARRNARVILACRDVRKGEQASIKITMETRNMNIVVMQVDLSLMKSVRSFVKKFLEQETRLDILVNNAGMAGRDMCVKDILVKSGQSVTTSCQMLSIMMPSSNMSINSL